jgi:hypothetical protein
MIRVGPHGPDLFSSTGTHGCGSIPTEENDLLHCYLVHIGSEIHPVSYL